jgi:thioredoxin-related protein
MYCYCSAETPTPVDTATNHWYGFNEGIKKAQTEKKKVVMDFYTSWCGWCKTMDEKVFAEKRVSAYLREKYICIRINAEDEDGTLTFQGKTYTPVKLTMAFGVQGFPSVAFLDKELKPITIIPGYVPADTFLKILGYMDQECYKKKVSVDEYLKNGCP